MNTTEGTDVVVSVAMPTYNHEAFVAEAIEGVLRQETGFRVDLVVGEDCSTDGTRAIVQGYAERFPGRIRLLLAERNQGMMANFCAVLSACRGRYVALLDGDDYWTDPAKLQKQVEFLESHPSCAICFHDVLAVFEGQPHAVRRYCRPDQKEISSLEDLLAQNFIPACSSLFRRGFYGELPPDFVTLPWGDWPLQILIAQHGQIGYIDQVMGVYRVHTSSASASWRGVAGNRRIYENRIVTYRFLDRCLDPRYRPFLKRRLAFSYYQLAAVDRRQRSRLGVLRNLAMSIGTSPLSPPIPYRQMLRKLLPLLATALV